MTPSQDNTLHTPRIPVLLVTYNRMLYTEKCLDSICDAGVPIEINIFDNHSTDDTVEWLHQLFDHGAGDAWYGMSVPGRDVIFSEIVYNTENQGLAKTMNWFFRKYATQPYVVKVDNDTVLPKNWLKDLLDVMEAGVATRHQSAGAMSNIGWRTGPGQNRLGAVSPTCLRPNGQTFKDWAKDHMVSVPFGEHQLHYNSYILGTGVLINMDMIRERGLLFEHFPYGPETPSTIQGGQMRPVKTCLISGWGAYQRIAADYDGWKFAFYSKVHANLLNLKEEFVLSNDYPEYDEELKDARDQGNAWWESVGGLPGVKMYVDAHGGLEKLKPWHPNPGELQKVVADYIDPQSQHTFRGVAMRKNYLTDCDDRKERSTQKWWEERVAKEGVFHSIFKDQTQSRTNEFTAIHETIIRQEIKPYMDVLEVGCGWGRMAPLISQCAKSYVGTDFVEQLLVTARETLPKLDFRYADAGALPFEGGSFDAVVAVACVSSFDERFDAIMQEMLRVVKKGGFVLLLEEEWSRMQWKLENK